MKYAGPVVFFCCLCLTTMSVASNASQPETEPAKSLTKPGDGAKANESKPAEITPKLSRGQLLYENHCTKCHESKVHIRNGTKAKNISDVQGWVAKWQAHEKLDWRTQEINDVTQYLLEHFYKFK